MLVFAQLAQEANIPGLCKGVLLEFLRNGRQCSSWELFLHSLMGLSPSLGDKVMVKGSVPEDWRKSLL